MIGFILNIPYTAIGLLLALISRPKDIKFLKSLAFIVDVKSLWWTIGYMRGARAVTFGHVVILGPKTEPRDLNHELVHVKQYKDAPIIFPFLYYFELIRKGYKNNKYEIEAYKEN